MEFYGEPEYPKKALPHRLLKRQRHHPHGLTIAAVQIMASVFIFSAVFFFFYSPMFYLRLQLFLKAHSVQSLSLSSGSSKNYMFLLCNGILAILGLINISSCSSSSSSSTSSSSSSFSSYSHPQLTSTPPHQWSRPIPEEHEAAASSPVMETRDTAAMESVEDQGNAGAPVESGVQYGDLVEGHGSACETEAETLVGCQEEDDEEGMMSIEELNRECENFIRRMKREIYFGLD
ncbi:hypothetical protein SAY87_003551 [Trapa incisa]|uniref:Uncharacterized protein n=1 Tax=Trapa incisa TaxID=236973 RepID=A0AAN7QLA9_9MYRT|nr:hypothetical protein SAY87_003551 [Trapa incisa]